MVGFNPTRRMVATRLAMAAGIPVLGMGLPFACAVVRDHSPIGGFHLLSGLIFFYLFVAAAAIPFFVCNRRRRLGVAAGVGVMACLLLTMSATTEWTLGERGLIDHCLVTEVTTEYIGAGSATSPVSTSHLQCPHGLDTTSDALGGRGTFVTVLWDPSHRIGTRSTDRWIASETKFRLAVGAASAGTLLVLLDILIDLRRRPRALLTHRAHR